jgi:hypothetical protein
MRENNFIYDAQVTFLQQHQDLTFQYGPWMDFIIKPTIIIHYQNTSPMERVRTFS